MEDRTVVDPGAGYGDVGPGDATRVMTVPPAGVGAPYSEATQQALVTSCPVCATPNGPTEAYCQDCGFMFGSAAEVQPLPDAADMPRLVDPASGREFLLNPGVNTVGREGADVLISDATVSRRHAQITAQEGSLLVEDLGSTNGTAIAGRVVKPGESGIAYTGESLRFGSITLEVALPGGEARPAALPAPAPAEAPVQDRGEPVAALLMADGTSLPLFSGVNTVGRRSSNDVVLADAFASGSHAEIRCDDGSARLVDTGSTNGTFVEGERLQPGAEVELAEGTAVTFGKTPITFTLGRTAAPEPEEDAAGDGDEAAQLG